MFILGSMDWVRNFGFFVIKKKLSFVHVGLYLFMWAECREFFPVFGNNSTGVSGFLENMFLR